MTITEQPGRHEDKPLEKVGLDRFSGLLDTTLVMGRHSTGKTTFLINKVFGLLERGINPEDILVVCASALSKQDFEQALDKKLDGVFAFPNIETTRRIALDILADKEAVLQTGRYPRLLADFERDFLNQDLKTLGIKVKRMEEMLKFFYRSWTELADEDPNWLISGEEKKLHALLIDKLTYLHGMLEPELVSTAVKWLTCNTEKAKKWQCLHVLVDDYQLLSRASQLLVHLLAAESLTVTGDKGSMLEVFDSYPYAAGLDEFFDINPDALQIDLKESCQSDLIIHAQNSLLAEEALAGIPELHPAAGAAQNSGKIAVESVLTPVEEFDAVADLADSLLASGHSTGDMAITTFSQIWARQIEAALRKRGIPVELHYRGMNLNGDFRDLGKSRALRAYTALRLVANPNDDFSWRCWCGFGDYLANSAVLEAIESYGAKLGSSLDANTKMGSFNLLLQSLETIDNSSIPGIEKILSLYHEGRDLIKACKGLSGAESLKQIVSWIDQEAGISSPASLQIPGWDNEDLSSSQLVDLYEQHLFFPELYSPTDSVLIIDPASLAGKHFKTLLVSGFVNGFIPQRDYFDRVETPPDKQRKIRRRDIHLISLLLGSALNNLVFTYFERIDLESAERLRLSIKRIRSEKGERICTIAPSEYLDLIRP